VRILSVPHSARVLRPAPPFITIEAMTHKNLEDARGKVVAIDGPAGSGKSTTAKLVAAALGYQYLDTGAMYRALTWYAIGHKIDFSDAATLSAAAEHLTIEFKTQPDINRVFMDDIEVTAEIRLPEVTRHVSEVAAHKGVRAAMVAKQQEIGRRGSIVAEGRDTTTVVFRDAEVKVFLEASVEVRAERRFLEMKEMDIDTTVDLQIADIKRRDSYDSGREHSPLMKAPDAHVIDTSHLTIEQQVAKIIELAEK